MAFEGYLYLFTPYRPKDPRVLLDSALRISGASRIGWAARSVEEDREWELLQRSRHLPDVIEETAWENIGRTLPPAAGPSLYQEERCLMLSLRDTTIDEHISEAVHRSIPLEILGNFQLPGGGLALRFGYHDIFETTEHEEGRLFGRSFFSIILNGFGCPNDWEETRRRIFEIPELQRIKKAYEEIAGPLQQCIYWDG